MVTRRRRHAAIGDKLVAPGVAFNPDDNSYGEHELRPEVRRR
jgi:hypothetical protein